MQDVFIKLINMPLTIKAYTVLNHDDSYTIILNSRVSYEQRLLSYEHELRHIHNGDYEKHSADLIEIAAHSDSFFMP